MSDLIDRLRAPKKIPNRPADEIGWIKVRDPLQIEAADALERMQWVSVEDRLPERRDLKGFDAPPRGYIVNIQHPRHQYVTRATWADLTAQWVHQDARWITHWMPLPEPPEAT